LYDDQLYVEHGDKRCGLYTPIDGPIPLHRYRSFKKTRNQQRVERVEGLAKQLSLLRAALSEYPVVSSTLSSSDTLEQPFVDPDPFHELTFPSALDAKRAIADHPALPLAKLAPEQLAALNTLLEETLAKSRVWDHVRRYLEPFYRR